MMKDDNDRNGDLDISDAAGDEGLIPEKSSSGDGAVKKRVTTKKRTVGKDGKPRRLKKKTRESSSDKLIKYGALFLLVAQMVGLVLLMRYSRTNHPDGQPMYLASTAVFVMEVMKLVICCFVIAYQSGGLGSLLGELKLHVLQSPAEMAKLSVPSFLYTVQNNLLYLALSNLDAATYQVCYQLKILTTAVFSMLLLQVRIHDDFWFCVAMIMYEYDAHYISHVLILVLTFGHSNHFLPHPNVHHFIDVYTPPAKILRKEMGSIDSIDNWGIDCASIREP